MLTFIAMVADQVDFRPMMNLLNATKHLYLDGLFEAQIKLFVENNVMPQVDKMQAMDIFVTVQSMKTNRVSNTVHYDLVAAEYARKIQAANGQLASDLSFNQKVMTLKGLIEGGCTQTVIEQTITWTFSDYTEALFVLTRAAEKNEGILPRDDQAGDDIILAMGLFDSK